MGYIYITDPITVNTDEVPTVTTFHNECRWISQQYTEQVEYDDDIDSGGESSVTS